MLKRYALNQPSDWVFDATAMMYGACFMMCGAYTLAQNRHVRGDFVYGSLRPRVQASLDLALYVLFFVPGILALCFAGWGYARDSWAIGEHSSTTADGVPLYHFKTLIPIAGTLVLAQGVAEMARCVVCLRRRMARAPRRRRGDRRRRAAARRERACRRCGAPARDRGDRGDRRRGASARPHGGPMSDPRSAS